MGFGKNWRPTQQSQIEVAEQVPPWKRQLAVRLDDGDQSYYRRWAKDMYRFDILTLYCLVVTKRSHILSCRFVYVCATYLLAPDIKGSNRSPFPATSQWTQTSLRHLQDVLKRSRRLTTKPDVVTTSYRRRLIYDVLKTSDLRRLEDVRFTTSWRRLIYVVLKTSDLRRLQDVWLTTFWRRLIYDVLKTSVKRRLL